jgi:hypothetical protein
MPEVCAAAFGEFDDVVMAVQKCKKAKIASSIADNHFSR